MMNKRTKIYFFWILRKCPKQIKENVSYFEVKNMIKKCSMAEYYVSSLKKSRNTHKHSKIALNFFLTCTNDHRITWGIREQNFTSLRKSHKMAEYDVNSLKW